MAQAETRQSTPVSESRTSSLRQCWICFATEEDEDAPDPPQWTQPCRCRGTTKWAHQSCLLLWVDLKMKTAKEPLIRCPQCKTAYRIVYPSVNTLASILTKIDSAVYVSCPFIAGLFTTCLVYWSAFTYGSIVFVQVVGLEEAVAKFESLYSSGVLFVSLPAIPILLLLVSAIQWEDRLLELLRKIGGHSPSPLRYILPEPVENSTARARSLGQTEGTTCTRVCVGAFILPTIAVLSGNLLFGNKIQSAVTRTLMGGLAYTVVTGIFSMYQKQQMYRRVGGMRVLDYVPSQQENQTVAQNPVL